MNKPLVFEFSFEWGARFTEEEGEFLKTYLGNDFKLEDVKGDDGKYKLANTWKDFTASIEPILERVPHIKLTIKQLKDATHYTILTDWIGKLSLIAERLEKTQAQQQLFNQKCNVHVPGLGLLCITDVTYEEDCCTEYLQKKLESGWRILAVCPQPDQRRPDYILGRNSSTGTDY